MRQYFDNIDSLDRFTLELDCHHDQLQCIYCFKSDQFVSHGFIYKQLSQTVTEEVGKRILCSNRNARSGCGRTFRLYIATQIPSLQYNAAHLFVFLSALLLHATVKQAYQKATGKFESRNAWRWLNKLTQRLTHYRCLVQRRIDTPSNEFNTRARRLQHLLPTLQQLFSMLNHCPCSDYQHLYQSKFM